MRPRNSIGYANTVIPRLTTKCNATFCIRFRAGRMSRSLMNVRPSKIAAYLVHEILLVFLLVSTRGPAQILTDADGFTAEKCQAGHAAAEAV